MMRALVRHPLSAAFPSMSPEELGDLAADIKANGLRAPIMLLDGQVLDGWHRYTACIAVGVDVDAVDLPDDLDPVAYVLGMNLQRRHLTVSQRAIAVASCIALRPLGSNQHDRGSAVAALPASEVAKRADISRRSLFQAQAVVKAGLGDAVRDGRVSVERAAEISKLPKADWVEALQRKTAPRPAPEPDEAEPEPESADDLVDDMLAELQTLRKITEADDQLAAAWDEAKVNTQKLAQLEHQFQGKCAELSEMTKIAARWKRKFEEAEKALKAARS